MEEFIELPSDGRLINKRYITSFDPKRNNRLNFNGVYDLLRDPRDVKAVTDALKPKRTTTRKNTQTTKK